MLKRMILATIIASLFFNACKKDNIDDSGNSASEIKTPGYNPDITYGLTADQEGNVYKTVNIGTQTWMAENLRTTIYNDGTPIPNVTDNDEWGNLITGAYCNYMNTFDNDSIAIYGRLYNGYAIKTGKLAPIGWHIPSNDEWTTLFDYLGGEDIAGGKLKESGYNHWKDPNTGATNSSGFTALPSGIRGYYNKFFSTGTCAFLWSLTEKDTAKFWSYVINHDTLKVSQSFYGKHYGLSIRCLKD